MCSCKKDQFSGLRKWDPNKSAEWHFRTRGCHKRSLRAKPKWSAQSLFCVSYYLKCTCCAHSIWYTNGHLTKHIIVHCLNVVPVVRPVIKVGLALYLVDSMQNTDPTTVFRETFKMTSISAVGHARSHSWQPPKLRLRRQRNLIQPRESRWSEAVISHPKSAIPSHFPFSRFLIPTIDFTPLLLTTSLQLV